MTNDRPIVLRTAAALALALFVAACTPAGRVATAGPVGLLIIGMADEAAATSVFFLTRRFTLTLAQANGQTAAIIHRGCDSYEGLFAGEPCVRDARLTWQVLELAPGDWQATSLHLDVRSGFPAQDGTIDATLPPGLAIHIGPGEVVYAGDFMFGVDPATRTGSVKAHDRNDAAASRALAAYPTPTHGFVYREPTRSAAAARVSRPAA